MMNIDNPEKPPSQPITKAQRRRKRCRNCSLSLGLWLLFGLAVSKIIMGAEFGCSLDNKVIVYLVLSGSVILLITVLFIAMIIAFGADNMFSKKMKKLTRVPIIVCLIHLPWLIVGSVWGFRNLKDVLDGCSGDCCNNVLVYFAVSTIAVDWLLTLLTIVSIHYMDISKKHIISLFLDKPPVFVDVGTQHDNAAAETDDEKIIKERPALFEEFEDTSTIDQTHMVTGKRGIPAVHDVTDEVTVTPIQTFQIVDSPRQPPSALTATSSPAPAPASGILKPTTPAILSNLPNLAESPNQMMACDLLPTARDLEASKTSDGKASKSNGGKSKGKTKKNKKA